MGYQGGQELMRDVRDLERKVKAARLRAGELEDEVRDYRSLARHTADAFSRSMKPLLFRFSRFPTPNWIQSSSRRRNVSAC